MQVRSFTYSRYHGKGNVGSTRLRVNQLQKYWPDYQDYKYGENPDVIVFQKVYVQPDWKFIEHFEGIKILDICDADWMEQQNIKQTLDAVDGAVCPTQALADFLKQLTDKPIRVIPDRHDLEDVPEPKQHRGTLSKVVWFGYRQNAELLRLVVPALDKQGIELTVISNDNPFVDRWGSEDFKYSYQRFDEDTILEDLRQYDACILPVGNRPQDRFKSDNKTTLAWLAGLPVISDSDDLKAMKTAQARNTEAERVYNRAKALFDVKLSVQEMKEFISELSRVQKSPTQGA